MAIASGTIYYANSSKQSQPSVSNGKMLKLRITKLSRKMRLLFIAYLVLLHVFMIAALVQTDILARVQNKLISNVEQEEITPFYYAMVDFHKRVDKNIPENSVIFLGDSLIQGLAVSSVASPAFNFGIGADTTEGLIQRIPHYSAISRSQKVVIAIGVNDLNRRDNKEIMSNYKKIVSLIPSNIPILFSAVLPIEEVILNASSFNERIRNLNSELEELCGTSKRLYFLDITNQLKDPDGGLSGKFHIGDGLHLNGFGNAVWITRLKEGLTLINSSYNEN